MAKRLTSIRISDYTTAQIQQLAALYETNQSDVMTMAISRMYRQDIGGNPLKKEQDTMNTETVNRAVETSRTIYTEVYGHIDDKFFKAQMLDEIENWLVEGDPDYDDIPALVAEWQEYNANK